MNFIKRLIFGVAFVLLAAVAIQAAPTPGPTLSSDQQKAIAALMALHGRDIPLNASVTFALGLSKKGEVLTLRQVTINAHPVLHGYVPLPDGGLLLMIDDQVLPIDYRLDANLKLLAAVSMKGDAPVVVSVSDAQDGVNAEISYWAGIANRH